MPRLDIPELEDQRWFPPRLRNLMTEYLYLYIDLFELYRPVTAKLAAAMRVTGDDAVLDLCSGGSGPWRKMAARLKADHGLSARATLSDLYPNIRAFKRAQSAVADGALTYIPTSIDATAVPPDLKGFRTLFTCLHHFSPALVGRILQDAVNQRRGVGAFEMSARSLLGLASSAVGVAALPLLSPFLRPFRWDRLVLTHMIPIVPACFAWDSFASQLRSYTPDDLRDIVATLDGADTYTWDIGGVWHPYLPMRLTYLIGTPA